MIPLGRRFYKMTGSGNDFLMIDSRVDPPGELADPRVTQRLCARGTGVGADGIVFLLPPESGGTIKLVYLNADGSRADFCGNATLCTSRLAVELGAARPEGFQVETDSGMVAARIRDSQPEIDLQPVTDVRREAVGIDPAASELAMGFAMVGVPHLVVLCPDAGPVDVVGRGRPLRNHPTLSTGANVNFVSPKPDGRWRVRTYERGVEGETLACGSGAVATAILLTVWGKARGDVSLETSSGRTLRVRLDDGNGTWKPSLSGEARVVFQAQLSET